MIWECVYLHIGKCREVRSDHKWSLRTHLETHSNAWCEHTYLELSTYGRITQDTMYMPGVNKLKDALHDTLSKRIQRAETQHSHTV